jgi:hypothetical protein
MKFSGLEPFFPSEKFLLALSGTVMPRFERRNRLNGIVRRLNQDQATWEFKANGKVGARHYPEMMRAMP